MRVEPIACLSDNYAYWIAAEGADEALVVDPSEPLPVERALARAGLRLGGILCTHHHGDHVGGVEGLARPRGGVPVFGSAYDLARGRIPGQTVGLADGEAFEVAGVALCALSVPGHTLGAVAYLAGGAVFTGDTLFVAGCGRLFEGTAEEMHDSLSRRLAALPGETRVYCGHEYTVANLTFAAVVDPKNDDVREKLARARAARARGEPTVPSTIDEELRTNPFLRAATPALARRFGGGPEHAVFAALRRAKDEFRG